MRTSAPAALVIGGSSGIGEALARELHKGGWRLGILARREDRLETLAASLGSGVLVGYLDACDGSRVERFRQMADRLDGVDLVIFCAGYGDLNPAHDAFIDETTLQTNVNGFAALARAAFLYLLDRPQGQLAAVTSVAALRGSGESTSYAASKAFQSVYLDGLRESSKKRVTITELQPGFVDTAMMKTATPLPPLLKRLLVSSPTTAARQMVRAIAKKKKHAYITGRYALIALLLRVLPRPG